jgi:hypothetical protein
VTHSHYGLLKNISSAARSIRGWLIFYPLPGCDPQVLVFGLWHLRVDTLATDDNFLAELALGLLSQTISGLIFVCLFLRMKNLLSPTAEHAAMNVFEHECSITIGPVKSKAYRDYNRFFKRVLEMHFWTSDCAGNFLIEALSCT